MGDCIPLLQRQLLALTRLAITGNTDDCLMTHSIDWNALYAEAEKQCLLGIVFAGIERLPKEKRPDMACLANWLWQAQHIKTKNDIVNGKIHELSKRLSEHGFNCILLKGQGVAQLYETSTKGLSSLRTSGDIDVWIPNHSRKEILSFLRSTSKSKYMVYHNAEYPVFDGSEGSPEVPVEVHFTPSWFWNPLRNRKFQKFCKESIKGCLENKELIGRSEVSVPTLKFNRVFILQHIYRHVFAEGIGLRQLIDYYMVLSTSSKCASDTKQDKLLWTQEKEESFKIIKHLGMEQFCGAVMWILVEYLGLNAESVLCEPNEKYGQNLMAEILQGGNFGHYDERNKHKTTTTAGRFWHHVKRDLHYINSYPGEVLWVPAWKVWHYFWRMQYNKIN